MKNILEVEKINKFLDKKQILFDVSFSVKEAEIYGFIWPNWAWKTTAMKAILGLIKPESGVIKIFWNNWINIEVKKQIWFMPENTYLYKYLTGREFLKFNWKFFDLTWKNLEKIIDELLVKVWLEDDGDKLLKKYSKWMLQRIGLAQSIINKPKLVFLDEPMSGLDPIWRKMVKDLLVELKQNGTTVFFNTHILADVESICDRISIIHKWKIIVSGKEVSEIKGWLEEFFIEKVSEK